ncbi:MAG: hypothetical protein KatS3mg108_2086 [Isosphaeraceae bacterium]|jgi:hypothetical protein|nr:MAG: hypothetical protein KatS3mg108_2086 [Isosphaeraceae bacterium]
MMWVLGLVGLIGLAELGRVGGWVLGGWTLIGYVGAMGVCGWIWTDARGTALRPAVVWSGVSLGVLMADVVLGVDGRPLGPVGPVRGGWTTLGALAVVASAVSVLNARNPGAGVWAGLVGVLVVMVVIRPLALGGGDLVQALGELGELEVSWRMFLVVLAVVGLGNYAGTRRWKAALVVGLGVVGWFVFGAGPAAEWQGVARWVLLGGLPLGWLILGIEDRQARRASSDLERLWYWFRDRWGLVWGLRVLERLEREAEVAGWTFRLGWDGVEPRGAVGEIETSDLAAATPVLRGLLHRFARPWRLDRVVSG